MLRYLLVFSIYVLCVLFECNAQNEIKACIIQVENGKVYLDATSSNVRVGDVLSVRSTAGYMIHPVTKKKIAKEGEIIADLEIKEIYSEYSIASIYPETAISKLKAGMYASMPELPQEMLDESVEENVTEDLLLKKPLTADGIMNRYLEVTGLNKMVGKSFSLDKEVYYMDRKKSRNFSISLMVEPQSKKLLYKGQDKKNLENIVYALNGTESRLGFYSAVSKIKETFANELFSSLSDPFSLKRFVGMRRVNLCGSKYVDGEMCTGVEFCGEKYNDRIRYYFSDTTGYLLLEEKEGVFAFESWSLLGLDKDKDGLFSCEVKHSGYRQFGDLLLASNKHIIISGTSLKGNIEYQEILYNVTFGNVMFGSSLSKDGVKQILKEMRKNKK